MLEKFLAAEVLEIRVLHPAIAQSLVGKVVCLRTASPVSSRVGNGGWPGLSVYTAPNLSSRKRQSIACPSFTNACFMSMIWSSRERNRSCSLVSRRSRGRIANSPRSISSSEKNHGLRFEGILKSICKEIALQRPKSGNFDYLCAPGHSAHSMASEFFTDDFLTRRIAVPLAGDHVDEADEVHAVNVEAVPARTFAAATITVAVCGCRRSPGNQHPRGL